MFAGLLQWRTGPTQEKLETFIRQYLVYDSSQVPDELIRKRYEASLDPGWWPARHWCVRKAFRCLEILILPVIRA